MWKVILPLLLVVGLVSARPSTASDDSSTTTTTESPLLIPSAHFTVDDFLYLHVISLFFSSFERMIPKEFIPVALSIPLEDSLNHSTEPELREKLQKKFPAILKKFMAAAKKFFKRANALPLEAKRVLATIVYINHRVRQQGGMRFAERFEFISTYMSGLPEAMKKELDEMIPKLSEMLIPDPAELEAIKEKAKKAIACEDRTVNKCGVYKRVMETGDLQDAIQFI
uniref:Fatty-acid and retinol-binding protein 1 n=1 Tax=Steinernema glaseri TaxID=37863 RepID=A0A1I7XYD7_9BILA